MEPDFPQKVRWTLGLVTLTFHQQGSNHCPWWLKNHPQRPDHHLQEIQHGSKLLDFQIRPHQTDQETWASGKKATPSSFCFRILTWPSSSVSFFCRCLEDFASYFWGSPRNSTDALPGFLLKMLLSCWQECCSKRCHWSQHPCDAWIVCPKLKRRLELPGSGLRKKAACSFWEPSWKYKSKISNPKPLIRRTAQVLLKVLPEENKSGMNKIFISSCCLFC